MTRRCRCKEYGTEVCRPVTPRFVYGDVRFCSQQPPELHKRFVYDSRGPVFSRGRGVFFDTIGLVNGQLIEITALIVIPVIRSEDGPDRCRPRIPPR